MLLLNNQYFNKTLYGKKNNLTHELHKIFIDCKNNIY